MESQGFPSQKVRFRSKFPSGLVLSTTSIYRTLMTSPRQVTNAGFLVLLPKKYPQVCSVFTDKVSKEGD